MADLITHKFLRTYGFNCKNYILEINIQIILSRQNRDYIRQQDCPMKWQIKNKSYNHAVKNEMINALNKYSL